jgi:predicted dehydrogenase
MVAGVALLGAPAILSAQSPGRKLNLAIIGCGGRGGANLKEMSGENIVVLCDVNEVNLDAAAVKFPNARKFVDFRKVFDEAKDIDAVVVSTAEHTHAFATMLALKAGKHVYCEKPLTHSVWEARQIIEAAKRARVVTQMGTQIHAGNNYRRVVELVQSGAIGPVTEVHVWVSRAWGLQSSEKAKANGDRAITQERPTEAMPIPAGLHWDLWLGPAPERAFNEVYFPGPKWYRWWDFGGGTMSDLGSHWNDLPFWALKLRHPLTIEGKGPPAHPEIAPASFEATYEYGPRENLPAVKLTWYQGENKPPQFRDHLIPQWANGVLFVGAKGMLLSDYGKHILLPEQDFKNFKPPEPFIPNSIGHHAEWINACKTGGPTTCHFDYSGALTEANHLGNVAYRVGKKISWDAERLMVTNAPEAAKLIRREYRKGWALA